MIEVYKLLTNKYDNNTETRPMWSEKVRRSLSLNLARQWLRFRGIGGVGIMVQIDEESYHYKKQVFPARWGDPQVWLYSHWHNRVASVTVHLSLHSFN